MAAAPQVTSGGQRSKFEASACVLPCTPIMWSLASPGMNRIALSGISRRFLLCRVMFLEDYSFSKNIKCRAFTQMPSCLVNRFFNVVCAVLVSFLESDGYTASLHSLKYSQKFTLSMFYIFNLYFWTFFWNLTSFTMNRNEAAKSLCLVSMILGSRDP